MAFVFLVKGKGTGNATSDAATIDSTGCDFFAAVVTDFQSSAKTTVTDSQGGGSNTWLDDIAEQAVGGACRTRIVYCKNPTKVGATHVITAAGGGSNYVSLDAVFGFSGGHLTAPKDQVAAGATSGAATDLSPGTLTPTLSTDLIIVACGIQSPATLTVTGETTDDNNQVNYSGGVNFGGGGFYRLPGSTAAYTPTCHATALVINTALMVTFKAATGGGGGGDLRAFIGEPITGSSALV